jgi:hypothetical protein
MRYNDFEIWVSQPRIFRYIYACDCNKRQALALYRANIRLSQAIFAILGLFEIALRNAIDNHYCKTFGSNWLYDAVQPAGFLRAKGCEKSLVSVKAVITKLGPDYTHNKAIAELTFGFWTHQFNSKHFQASGSTLLKIFPTRPFATNHTAIFNILSGINRLRNRIAHHEPICFEKPVDISACYATKQYQQILEVMQWLGINTPSFLFGIDRVLQEANSIHNISKPFNVFVMDE